MPFHARQSRTWYVLERSSKTQSRMQNASSARPCIVSGLPPGSADGNLFWIRPHASRAMVHPRLAMTSERRPSGRGITSQASARSSGTSIIHSGRVSCEEKDEKGPESLERDARSASPEARRDVEGEGEGSSAPSSEGSSAAVACDQRPGAELERRWNAPAAKRSSPRRGPRPRGGRRLFGPRGGGAADSRSEAFVQPLSRFASPAAEALAPSTEDRRASGCSAGSGPVSSAAGPSSSSSRSRGGRKATSGPDAERGTASGGCPPPGSSDDDVPSASERAWFVRSRRAWSWRARASSLRGRGGEGARRVRRRAARDGEGEGAEGGARTRRGFPGGSGFWCPRRWENALFRRRGGRGVRDEEDASRRTYRRRACWLDVLALTELLRAAWPLMARTSPARGARPARVGRRARCRQQTIVAFRHAFFARRRAAG